MLVNSISFLFLVLSLNTFFLIIIIKESLKLALQISGRKFYKNTKK